MRKIKRLLLKIKNYYNYIFKVYNYNEKKYPETFLKKYPKKTNFKLQKAPEIIYTFWTGNNELTPNRKKGLDSLRKFSDVEVKLITPQSLPYYILKTHPLHSAYKYLSLVHRSDYLRAYFMYYYGGGYADIKQYNKSWLPAFKYLNIRTNKWVLGYQELGAWGVPKIPGKLGFDLRQNYLYLIGNGAFIYKPKSPIAKEWLIEVEKRLDFFLPELKNNPATDFFGQNKNYPIPWAHILGEIHHPLVLKYYDKVLFHKNVLPSMKNYR